MQELKLVKELAFGDNARSKVLAGVNKLTQAVGSTLGASGKCVILEDQNGKPIITKDGVTVANSITLQDPLENIGAVLIREAARKTVKEAGDGTTTATVLAKAILDQANEHSLIDDVRSIKNGINLAVKKVVQYLESNSSLVKGETIKQVATISANNDEELGKLISDAFISVDETGVVIMETHDEPETIVEKVEGVQYEKGIINKHFITDKEKAVAELDNPCVLIVESKIENIRKIQGVLEYVIKNNKSLLIIADVETQVLTALAMNKVKGNIKVNIIDAPTYGINKRDTLDDLAVLTGATLINEDLGDDMDLIQPEHLGTCIKATTSANDTVIQIKEIPKEVKGLIKDIKSKIKKSSNPNYNLGLEKRLARLLAKIAIIKVGANSEVELKEKKDRVEDAICATKAAIKEGIVPGGGIALLNASTNLEPKSVGEEVLYQAIKKPYELILSNAGVSNYEDPTEDGKGLNVVTGQYVDMVKSGIIDPLLVTKSALTNAASVATTILSTDCVINNVRL